MKIVVGILTGSLGILAEAAHSALDLVAALITFFAVRIAGQPADTDHTYGHGKIENLSAFFEAGLLLATAGWVIYEAIKRIILNESHVEISFWAFLVMGISIVVDFSRSRMLKKVARKTGSQALEADALHFSTDIWSSAVVIGGLAIVWLTESLHLPSLFAQADAVAALGVSGIVIWVSIQLARETIDVLLDKAPPKLDNLIQDSLKTIPDILTVKRLRIRSAGNSTFIELVVTAANTLSFMQTHHITEQIERTVQETVQSQLPAYNIDVTVHIEPVEI
jgi:cation diffusion facilitator family transporter